MKYTLDLEIAAPRSRLVELLDDPKCWAQWQGTLVSSEPITGNDREVGSKTKLVHKFGHRDVEMVETIESKRLPEEIIYTYEAKGAWNRVVNRFEEIGPDRTRWLFEAEFKCGGVLRIASLFMPGMFRKASSKEMARFKAFVERELWKAKHG